MSAWKRYTIALLLAVWLFGNIPAWLFLPTYTSHNGATHQASYGLYWSLGALFVPAFAILSVLAFEMLREFGKWVIGPRPKRESRAERIERLERELGIGQ